MTSAQKAEKELLALPRSADLQAAVDKLGIKPFFDEDIGGGVYIAKLYKFADGSILGYWNNDGNEGVCSDQDDFDETVADNTDALCKWPDD
jgi:hypothetical protein